ncbi:hypothetical protein BU24DRAFT_468684 [Aaosphaeria arxii CBS 175.79]|uniref:Uncharacterized protein n=1 Tax=Aaosphaeria arxii CBS 175.79 TaxID=1450172 RepID=A0A6A5X6N7_9PLEO|nr:uncharacterized protein BU24DRAFT_468684 [Aaosphaeria arxii CBS 175.79]KAF2008562.1 hypothetical protein BU24DRAFT_468684 [Aaosphaeria arxii CBS 175.79]
MHFTTLIVSLATFAATGAAPLESRQEPNPVQIEVTTYGNSMCQDQIFNGFSMQYVVLQQDTQKCRTLHQDKKYPVGSVSAAFTPEATMKDSCVVTLYSDTECKEPAGVAKIGVCTTDLISEDVCPRPTGPKSFIYSC